MAIANSYYGLNGNATPFYPAHPYSSTTSYNNLIPTAVSVPSIFPPLVPSGYLPSQYDPLLLDHNYQFHHHQQVQNLPLPPSSSSTSSGLFPLIIYTQDAYNHHHQQLLDLYYHYNVHRHHQPQVLVLLPPSPPPPTVQIVEEEEEQAEIKNVVTETKQVKSYIGGGGRRHRHRQNQWRRKSTPSHEATVLSINSQTDTTLMVKNIPNRYTRDMLLDLLDQHCRRENAKLNQEVVVTGKEEAEDVTSAYDFLYLPVDFGTKCNKGYAFVNMTNRHGAMKLKQVLNSFKWGLFKSKKICEVTSARIQGKEALIKHFQSSSFVCDCEEFLPVYFNPFRNGECVDSVEMITVGNWVPSEKLDKIEIQE